MARKRGRRRNDRAVLAILLLNAAMFAVVAWYLIDFRITTDERKRLNQEIETELENHRRSHRTPWETIQ